MRISGLGLDTKEQVAQKTDASRFGAPKSTASVGVASSRGIQVEELREAEEVETIEAEEAEEAPEDEDDEEVEGMPEDEEVPFEARDVNMGC